MYTVAYFELFAISSILPALGALFRFVFLVHVRHPRYNVQQPTKISVAVAGRQKNLA